jgi:hypothetical protein
MRLRIFFTYRYEIYINPMLIIIHTFISFVHAGRQIKKGRGTSRIYPEPIDGPPFPLRSFEQHSAHLKVC